MDKLEPLKKDIYNILDKQISILKKNGLDEDSITIFKNCFLNTIDTTVTYNDDLIFVITGDIDAMWLRDSTCQVLHYLKYVNKSILIKDFIKALINKQFELIKIDPYANAFNKELKQSKWINDETEMNDHIWERKYELDSITYPIYLLNEYIRLTTDLTILNDNIIDGIKKCIDTYKIEMNHNELSKYTFLRHRLKGDYLINNGKGPAMGYTGMISQMFRPSDDPVIYPYNIPGNLFLNKTLNELYKYINDDNIKENILKITNSVQKGINEFGIKDNMYLYEVDGLGESVFMDDANMPSLLSLPLFDICDKEDLLYLNTRKNILSNNNKYYYSGKYASGIGSPHTPTGFIWPISLAVEGLTSNSIDEKKRILNILNTTHANTFYMHESFDKDDPSKYSRSWFSWANTMYALFVMDIYKLEDL